MPRARIEAADDNDVTNVRVTAEWIVGAGANALAIVIPIVVITVVMLVPALVLAVVVAVAVVIIVVAVLVPALVFAVVVVLDRKSTRLNSSHGYISYAGFCFEKKKKHRQRTHFTPELIFVLTYQMRVL